MSAGKPVRLRPQARRDRTAEVRYYQREAGSAVALRLIEATRAALERIEHQPGAGSPRLGQLLGIPGLRTCQVQGFPLLWFYIERADHLDVIRLLGERQDIGTLLQGQDGRAAAKAPDAPARR